MSRFYFSGIEKVATAEAIVKCNAAGMTSQILYSDNLIAACGDMPLVLDSSAYSIDLSKEEIERYARLICNLGERCIWYANADKIGDQAKSNENYAYLLSLLPPSLHDRILWIYQYGSDMSHLYEGLRQHKRIGIGGVSPSHPGR